MDVDRSPSWPASLTGTLLAGASLWAGIGLQPPWWWALLAPAPLLWLAYAQPRRGRAAVLVLLACLLGASHYTGYFRLVMPWVPALLATAGVALLWFVVVMGARRVVLGLHSGWSVLAYPLGWAGIDLLCAWLLPDGNWASPVYPLAGVLPLLQLSAIAGSSGMLFIACLPASALALLLARSMPRRQLLPMVVASGALLAIALGFGSWRLHDADADADAAPSLPVGIASIDDPIGPQATPAYWQPIRDRYDALVAQLAAQGAQLVLLPEKIATVPPAELARWQAHFAALARHHRLWLVVGIAEHGPHPRNRAWLFDPQGRRVADYGKHILAPPERREDYAASDAYAVQTVAGRRIGLAICKDMHFAALGRANGMRAPTAMLVPAWDFAYRDAWLAERITAMRGVESGYGVARAAREGLLSVSDAHGRILAQRTSAPMPGATLLARLPVAAQIATPYLRLGDAFGIGALVAWLLLAGLAQRRARARRALGAAASRPG